MKDANLIRHTLPDPYLERLKLGMNHYRLSPRERDVAWLYVHGLQLKEIAYTMEVSPNTARNHVRGVRDKVGVTDDPRSHNGPIRVLRILLGLPEKWGNR